MKKLVFNILLSLLLIGLISCSKELSYDFKVKNETNYHLNKILFDWCQGDNSISVEPNKSSEIFTLTYKTSGANFFGSGSLCITIESYSDSISNYENAYGIAIDRSKLDEGQLNTINIIKDINPYYETDIFTISLQ
ncbi:MAG: hypothetical protein K8R41_09020 [Bacteroidales bacterium]|nr:hypothetical protein [Bacteroidales bacterium]